MFMRLTAGSLALALHTATPAAPARPIIDSVTRTTAPELRAEPFPMMLQTIDPANPKVATDEMAQQFLAHFGRSDLLGEIAFHKLAPCPSGLEPSSLADLLSAASRSRVVIINEAHVAPWHRDTTRALLAQLKDHGYRLFAAETFNPAQGIPAPVVTHQTEPFARTSDGTYFEPHFGALVREAKRQGFVLTAYEETSNEGGERAARIARREAAQATELAALLAVHPDKKLLVHVGHGHVRETIFHEDDGIDKQMMAMRLKAKTGIDPVTVAQTVCNAPQGEASAVWRVPVGPLRDELGVDFVWQAPLPNSPKMTLRIPTEWIAAKGWTIVEARRADEPDEAVPIKWIAIRPGETGRGLALPPGRYRVRIITKD